MGPWSDPFQLLFKKQSVCILHFYQFCLISVCILHRKNINPVLKYPVFVPRHRSHGTVHTVLFTRNHLRHCSHMYLGLTRPISKKKNQKYLFQRSFYIILINIGWYFMLLKIQKSDIKIPGLRQNNSKSTKKLKKRKKMFLCIRPSVSNLKNHIVFFICQKIIF